MKKIYQKLVSLVMPKSMYYFLLSGFLITIPLDANLVPVKTLNTSEEPMSESEYLVYAETSVTRMNHVLDRSDLSFSLRNFTGLELRSHMYSIGYRDLHDLTKQELRRVFLAYEYDKLFWDMHESTGYPISLFYAYFIFEATEYGLESKMWRLHWNPGGIKHIKGTKIVYKYDDCAGSKCAFSHFDAYDQAVQYWSQVFLHPRYSICRMKKPSQLCDCFKSRGYHSDNSQYTRRQLMSVYWKYRRHFPRTVKFYPD